MGIVTCSKSWKVGIQLFPRLNMSFKSRGQHVSTGQLLQGTVMSPLSGTVPEGEWNNRYQPPKGFLSNINGTMEHIFATSSIVQNAMNYGLPLSVTFLDLKNAFGSVSHQLITDMLDHVGVPRQLRSYITNAYSQLLAYVVSKKWSTPIFHSQGHLPG